jgi:4a-hydroxytetrahydrobiopterin dehydratase
MWSMSLLSDAEITARLARLPGWERHGSEIRGRFSFADFKEAMAFVNRVADLAEAANHHPDIDVRYSKVALALSKHDAGGLTARDFDLAEKISA